MLRDEEVGVGRGRHGGKITKNDPMSKGLCRDGARDHTVWRIDIKQPQLPQANMDQGCKMMEVDCL